MATTTNYGWTTPNDTDLVRDGASAIRSLGSAIDTTVYNNANAAVQKTLVDAKGDLVTATANDTPARLAVGNNGETLVADSSATTGLRYNPLNVMANPVINGGFDIWQRGTSFAVANTYTADRWVGVRGGNVAGMTVSRQTTSDTTNLPNIQYAARIQRDSGNTSTNSMNFANWFETVNSIPFAGKTVTLSFYARKGANYSAASDTFTVKLQSGTGTDQNGFGTYTGQSDVITVSATLTSTWQRFAGSGTIGATATEIAVNSSFIPVGTAGANDWVEITGVQIDVGTYTASTAPTFRRAGGTLAGELAACQRYYWRHTAGSTYAPFATGQVVSGTEAKVLVPFPVPMRVNPTALEYSTVCCTNYTHGAIIAVSSLSIQFNSTLAASLAFVGTTSGFNAAGQVTQMVANNSTSAYIAFTAEL